MILRRLNVLPLFLLWVALAPALAEDAAPLATASGLLVLRNGNVLRGKILKSGDAFVLETEGGGTVRVPAASVDVACRDLQEAYQIKAGRLDRPSAHQRLDLAEWCLRMKLPAGAAEQLLLATRLDPTNPRLPALERKLTILAEPAPAAVHAPPPVADYLAPEELERAMESIPARAVEAFTNHVQPLLLNRCATATCHGPAGGSGFRLTRPSPGQPLTRRFTQRNLHAVLQQVDRANLEQSALLVVPQTPHGPLKAAVWSDRDQRHVEELRRFLFELAPQAAPPLAEIQRPEGALKQPAATAPGIPSPAPLPPPVDGDRSATEPGILSPEQRSAARLPPPAPFQPRDPFDPEIFNRQFHAGK